MPRYAGREVPETNKPLAPYDCKERHRLASEWSNAVSAYADAVRRYVNIARSSDVEIARVAAEKARLALEAHQQEHGC